MEDDPFSDPPLITRAEGTSSGAPLLAVSRPRWGVPSQLVLVILVVVSSGFLGLCVHQILAGIGASAEGLAQLSLWSWLLIPAMVACLTVSILCLVALVRTQASRLLVGIGALSSLVLPGIAAYVGARIGFDRATINLGGDLSSALAEVDLMPLVEWLLSFLGGD